MAPDDLSAPLGQNKKPKRRFTLPFTAAQLIAGLLLLALVVFGGWAVVMDDPLGGEPMAVIATGPLPKVEAVPPPATTAQNPGPRQFDGPQPLPTVVRSAPALPPGTKTITIIDGSTGKRIEVPIPGSQDKPAQAEQRLTEITPHGAIPKIAPDGARPADVYAQAAKTIPGKPDAPRIAIVLTGLGVSATATQDAVAKLPGPVTLAFLPYGNDVAATVARARAAGHEVLLQAPMEPLDYPDNDPGPQTLLHTLSTAQNIDRLHWQMSRFQGYVGIANFMGARFTAFEPAFAPVLREVSQRGLIYFDDSSSARSLAGQIAGANGVPFAKADVTLDSVASPAYVDKALARLEATARQNGAAVGVAAALPATIARIAQWAKVAGNRGLLLVPISNIAVKPKSS